jgi:hypothetical protein
MNKSLYEFSQLVLNLASTKKTGLIPIFSHHFNYQSQSFDFTIQYLKDNFSGFLVFKNNQFPEDNLKKLDFYLKPDTVIFINNLSNSFQYSEILNLSKNNLVIAGFETFVSKDNSLHDFIYRFQRISHIDFTEIKKSIPLALFCDFIESNKTFEYQIFCQ